MMNDPYFAASLATRFRNAMNKLAVTFSFAAMLLSSRLAARAADDIELLEEQAIRAAVERVAPSILKIETVGGLEKVGDFLIGTGPTTGMAVDPDGYVISSAFNFVQKPASILVTLPDGMRQAAQLVATDHSRMLVLLKVKVEKPLLIPEAAPLKDVQVGQWSIAVGRTFDGIKPNLSAGIVSALNRVWGKAIQTDAKVSPANYGGPLVDIRGRVLGVLVPLSPMANDEMAGVEWYDSGIGFAVPMEQINAALPRLKKGEDLFPGLIGVSLKGKDIYADAAEIAAVQPNSPAYKAGLKADDKIVELDGKPIATQAQMRHVLAPHYAGETVKLVVARGSEKITKELELVAKLTAYQHPFLGVLPKRDPPEKDAASVKGAAGITVRHVLADSPAAKAGLKVGDRIVTLDGKPVASREVLAEQIGSLAPGGKAKLEIRRGEEAKTLDVTFAAPPEAVPASLPVARAVRPAFSGDRPDVGIVHIKIPEITNECLAYVPENYDPEVAYGVVLWLHAPGGYLEDELVARWKQICADNDLILLAPKSFDPLKWQKTELTFIRKAFDEINRTYHVDPARVVAHGQEGGAGMAFLLAFANRDVIRAVAIVDGALPQGAQPPANEPAFPLAFYSGAAAKGASVKPIQAGIDKLRELKYPVTAKTLKDPNKYLTPSELAEFIRWIDSLDRI